MKLLVPEKTYSPTKSIQSLSNHEAPKHNKILINATLLQVKSLLLWYNFENV